MTNCEHLIENALIAMQKAQNENANVRKAFIYAMESRHNRDMLDDCCISQIELWEIAQYVMYVWNSK